MKLQQTLVLFIFMIMLISTKLYANLGLSLGAYVPFGFTTQKNANGDNSKMEYHPMISGNYAFSLTDRTQFAPEMALVFHRKTYNGSDKKTLLLLADLRTFLVKNFAFRYGMGKVVTILGGDGGTTTINGRAYTNPKDTVYAYNTTINLGLDLYFFESWALKFETYMFSFLSSKKRDFCYSLSLFAYL